MICYFALSVYIYENACFHYLANLFLISSLMTKDDTVGFANMTWNKCAQNTMVGGEKFFLP